VVAASSGFLAFYTLPPTHTEEAHTIMYWHLWLQVAAIAVFAAVVLARWRLRKRASAAALRITGLVAAGLLVVGSYLGGHLVYRGATGIDPSLLSPALREGHHHDGEGHEHPPSPPKHEPGHDHTHSHDDSEGH
jgi:ABC-type nickel/cobalt efflux system permease component RcnA